MNWWPERGIDPVQGEAAIKQATSGLRVGLLDYPGAEAADIPAL